MLDPKGLAAAKEWRGHGTTEQIIRAYLSAALAGEDEAVASLDDVAARMWKADAEDSGTPVSVAAGRTREAFDDQAENLKARWRKFTKAASVALSQPHPADERVVEALATVEEWQKWALTWAGSAFLSGETISPDDMTETEYKSELYSGMCKLSNHMTWLRDEIAALSKQEPVVGDRKRIDDALVSCAGLLRTLCHDEIGDTAAAELEYVRACIIPAAAPAPGAVARAPFNFDRYVNGVLMAEGITIERQTTLDAAMRAAASVASRGPNGEAPVLVYRPVASPQPANPAQVTNAIRGIVEDALNSAIPEPWEVAEHATQRILAAIGADAKLAKVEAELATEKEAHRLTRVAEFAKISYRDKRFAEMEAKIGRISAELAEARKREELARIVIGDLLADHAPIGLRGIQALNKAVSFLASKEASR